MKLREVTRKSAFRAALALAGMTQHEWAERQGVTAQHVSMVLAGERESNKLTGAVDAFIAKQLPHIQIAGRSSLASVG